MEQEKVETNNKPSVDNEIFSTEEQEKWQKFLSCKRVTELFNGDTAAINSNIDWTEPRNPFEKDCDRIIYSYPFRRLQDKTQVMPFPSYDFVHTRLTHSLEVSTVGRSLGRMVENFLIKERKLQIAVGEIPAIVTAACLAHDIGNPPFGHSGEDSISEYFRFNKNGKHIIDSHYRHPNITDDDKVEYYSQRDKESEVKARDIEYFEGNAMGFRILSGGSMNLTSATLAAFAKYPRESFIEPQLQYRLARQEERASQKKYSFFFTERELFKIIAEEVGLIPLNINFQEEYTWARHPLAFLVEAADDICYRIIDFEDGCRLKRISYTCTNRCKVDGCDVEKTGEQIIKAIATKHPSFKEDLYSHLIDNNAKISYLRSLAIGVLIQESFKMFKNNYLSILTGEIKGDRALIDGIPQDLVISLKEMKGLVNNGVYKSRDVLETEATGFEVLGGLIEAFVSVTDICLNCPPESQSKKALKIFELIPHEYRPQMNEEKYDQLIKIIDYVSGMTDGFAMQLFRTIKGIDVPSVG